jgi:hypothetical protein
MEIEHETPGILPVEPFQEFRAGRKVFDRHAIGFEKGFQRITDRLIVVYEEHGPVRF